MRASRKKVLVLLIFLLPLAVASRIMHQRDENTSEGSQNMQIKPAPMQGINFEVAGSTIPDCSHACGACSPCRRVTVSFKCSTAESCPVSYRCMCKGKVFPVPSARPKP